MVDNRFIPIHNKITPAITSIDAKVSNSTKITFCILLSLEIIADAKDIGIANIGRNIVMPRTINILIVNFALFSLNAGFIQKIPTLIAVTENAITTEYSKRIKKLYPVIRVGYIKYKRMGITKATGTNKIED